MSPFGPMQAVWFGQPVGLERPLGLWLAAALLAAAVVVVVRTLRQRRSARAWVTPGHEAKLVTDPNRGRRALRLGLGGLGLALLAFAWAGPTLGQTKQTLNRRGIDLVVAVDASRSMLATDVAPTRLTAARAAVEQLLGELGGDRIGVVAFARDAFVQAPLTTDYGAARLYLRAVDPLQMQQGGTALAEALHTAQGMFQRAEAGNRDRAVLLISDGEDWEGGAAHAAKALAGMGVHLYTLGVGTRAGAPVPVIDARGQLTGYEKDAEGNVVVTRPNPEALAAIAKAGDGQAFFDDGRVDTQPIAKALDALHKGDIGSGTRVVGLTRYQWFALPGVLLLAMALGMGEERRRRPGLRTPSRGAVAAGAALLLAAPAAHAARWYESTDPNVHAGLQAYQQGKFAEAAQSFAKAEGRRSPRPIATFDRGVALYKAGKAPEAVKAFAQGHTPELQGRDAYNSGVALASMKKRDEAITAFRHALEADPSNEDARHNLEVLLDQKKQEQQKQQQQKKDQDQKDQQKKEQDQKDQQQKKEQDQKDQQQKKDQQQGQNGREDQKKQDQQQKDQQLSEKEKKDQQQQAQQQQQQNQQDHQQQMQQGARRNPVNEPLSPRSEAERTLDQLKRSERLLPLERSSTQPPRVERHEHTW